MRSRKIIAVLMALVMCLSLMPMSAFAYGPENKTAEVAVSFTETNTETNAVITLTTKKDNSMSLSVPKSVGSYDGVTVTASRWESGSDNDLLQYSMNYDATGSANFNIDTVFESLTDYCETKKSNSIIVDVNDSDNIDLVPETMATYTLSGKSDEGNYILTAIAKDGGSGASQDIWEYISSKSGPKNFSVSNDYNGDSYMILSNGSSVAIGEEQVTVSTGMLKLDHFDDLDAMAEEIAGHVEYTDGSSNTGVTAVLKAGSILAIGLRVIRLERDLTVTMRESSFEDHLDEEYPLNDLYYSFIDVYTSKAKDSVSGSSAAEALAGCLDEIFYALAQITAPVNLTFTFSDGSASTADVLTGTTQGTTITTSGDVTLGNSSDGSTVTINENSTVTVGATTEASKEITVEDGNTTTTTNTEVTTSEYTVDSTQHVYEITTTTTTTQTVNNVAQTPTEDTKTTAITTTVDGTTVENDSSSTVPSDYINVAKVIVEAVADKAELGAVTEIQSMELKLANKPQDSYSPAEVRNTVANDNTNTETPVTVNSAAVVEVHPEVTITSSSAGEVTYEVKKGQLVDGATFLYTIHGLNGGQYYNVYHVHGDNSVEFVDSQAKQAEGTGDGNGSITVALNNFSYLVSVPANENIDHGLYLRTVSGVLGDAFLLVFKFDSNNDTDISGITFKVFSDAECTSELSAATDENSIGAFRVPAYRTETVQYSNAMLKTIGSTSTDQDGERWVFVKVFQKHLYQTYYVKAYYNNVEVAFDNSLNSSSDNTSYGYSFMDYMSRLATSYPQYSDLNSALISYYSNLDTLGLT